MRRSIVLAVVIVVIAMLTGACGGHEAPSQTAFTRLEAGGSPASTVAPSVTTSPAALQPATTTTMATAMAKAAATTLPSTTTLPTTTSAPVTTTAPSMFSYEREFDKVLIGGSAVRIGQDFAPMQDRFNDLGSGRWQSQTAFTTFISVSGGKIVAIVSIQDHGLHGATVTVPHFYYGMSLAELRSWYSEMQPDKFGGQPALRRNLLNGSFYAVGGCTTGGADVVAVALTGFQSTAEQMVHLGDCSQDKD